MHVGIAGGDGSGTPLDALRSRGRRALYESGLLNAGGKSGQRGNRRESVGEDQVGRAGSKGISSDRPSAQADDCVQDAQSSAPLADILAEYGLPLVPSSASSSSSAPVSSNVDTSNETGWCNTRRAPAPTLGAGSANSTRNTKRPEGDARSFDAASQSSRVQNVAFPMRARDDSNSNVARFSSPQNALDALNARVFRSPQHALEALTNGTFHRGTRARGTD
eukprot:TRINITY_DN72273_c0_g1_i1.p1 TRINITY_DN72273_c0_g1~~TRINITY_DN72273_c0_g1_i1.p1  ORF type:complete len:221 (+),score=12.13 TRINITY_DN72273_c0_g1_i1:150-812(+)